MKISSSIVLSTLTAAVLVGCGGSSSTTPTTTASSVTVERGALLGATVTDANGQVATATTASSNVYTFATTPVYPISATGGVIDIDNNGIDAGDVPFTGTLTSYSEIITPITTLIGNPTSDAGKAMIASLKEKSGITSDDDLLHKVPSAVSAEALVLTNAIFESFQANFDDDSTNDIDLTDATTLESTFTDLKDKINAYKTVMSQNLSGETDLRKISQGLEEENIIHLNKETLDTDTADYFKNNINSGSNYKAVKSTGEILVEANSVIYVINNTNDYVINNARIAEGVKFYPNATLDCSTLSGYSLDSTYDSTKTPTALPVIGSTIANFYTNTTTKSVCISQDYSNLPFIGGSKSAVLVIKDDSLFSSTGTTDNTDIPTGTDVNFNNNTNAATDAQVKAYAEKIAKLVELFSEDNDFDITTTNGEYDTYTKDYGSSVKLDYPITCNDLGYTTFSLSVSGYTKEGSSFTCHQTNVNFDSLDTKSSSYLEVSGNLDFVNKVYDNDTLKDLVIEYETKLYQYIDYHNIDNINNLIYDDINVMSNDIIDVDLKKSMMKLEYADLSNVTDISNLFMNTGVLFADISNWNVSNITNMQSTFSEMRFGNKNIDLSKWNVSNVTNMSYMFFYASEFNQSLGSWNVSNVLVHSDFNTGSSLSDTNLPTFP